MKTVPTAVEAILTANLAKVEAGQTTLIKAERDQVYHLKLAGFTQTDACACTIHELVEHGIIDAKDEVEETARFQYAEAERFLEQNYGD